MCAQAQEAAAKRDAEDATAARDAARADRDHAQADLDSARTERDSAQDDLAAALREKDAAKSDLAAAVAERDAARADLAAMKTRAEEAEKSSEAAVKVCMISLSQSTFDSSKSQADLGSPLGPIDRFRIILRRALDVLNVTHCLHVNPSCV